MATTRFVLCLLLLAPVMGLAETDCRSLTPLDEESLETFQFESATDFEEALDPAAKYRLGEIDVVRQDVFETADNWFKRQTNRLHMRTREDVLLSVLPMASGDGVDSRLLEEAERILRGKVYLYDARVIPRRLCGDVLDVYVVTRDVWTLTPSLALDRSGGENDIGVGIGDTNVLGSGKSISIGVEKDEDRRGINFAFSDPNVGGSRWATDALVVDSDDGERVRATLAHPFFALDTRHAFYATTDHFAREEGLFFLSDEVFEYDVDSRRVRLEGGLSSGLRGRFVNRLLFGYTYEEHDFDFPDDFVAAFPGTAPGDRRFGYPFIAFQRLEDDFDTRVNIDRVQRTEDLALGRRIYAELGYSSAATGGKGDHLVAEVSFADAAWLTVDHLATFRAGLEGYYDLDAGHGENVTAEMLAAYRYQQSRQWSLLVRGSVSLAWNQTVDQQLLLGGEEGLRGYPNRYQVGDRRLLVTVEQRYYSDIYPLSLFRLGGAVFLDAGRVWYEGDVPDWVPEDRNADHFGMLSNLGFGLRLESTRTRGDRILHLDVSFPLQSGPDVREVEVTVTAKATL